MTVVVTIAGQRTLGDLKARIADELARADLAPQIALAIDDAISEAATHRFWFNEVRGVTFPIAPGDDYYGSIDLSAMTEIDDLWLIENGQRRNLRPGNDLDFDRLASGTASIGTPYMWSRYGDFLRFYPLPDREYIVTVDGVTRFPPMVDEEWNPWTTAGERYIRALAKREVLANVIRDFDEAEAQDALAVRYRTELLSQTHDRAFTGQMACNG